MRFPIILSLAVMASLISACSLVRQPQPESGPGATAPSAPPPPEAGSAQPPPAPPSVPEQPRPPPKQFHLGPATASLVAQAHKQEAAAAYEPAAATLERALRIEPENPLLWIELGQVRLSENNAVQANGMGRKALALATGDAQAQSAAWHLIADTLRAQDRNPEAAEADKKAAGLSPR
jgi:tetratricopeptide (TPR) repeat protein